MFTKYFSVQSEVFVHLLFYLTHNAEQTIFMNTYLLDFEYLPLYLKINKIIVNITDKYCSNTDVY